MKVTNATMKLPRPVSATTTTTNSYIHTYYQVYNSNAIHIVAYY